MALPTPAHEGLPAVALRETCRFVPAGPGSGKVPLWRYHRERLAEGGCGPKLLVEVDDALAEVIADHDDTPSARLRLTISVDPSDPVSRVTAALERRLSSLDVPGGPVLVPVTMSSPPPLPQGAAKPFDRSYWDEALRRARPAGGQQALLLDSEGFVLDGATATVWAVRAGQLLTPPCPPAVAGVSRRFILDEAPRLGLVTEVAPLTATHVDLAEEVFLSNAFGGAVAVRGRGGPVTEIVARAFRELWAP